jgi:hypothetical protein
MSAEENPGGESSGENTSDERPSGKTDADGHEPEFVDHKTERDDSKGESNGIERSQNVCFNVPSYCTHSQDQSFSGLVLGSILAEQQSYNFNFPSHLGHSLKEPRSVLGSVLSSRKIPFFNTPHHFTHVLGGLSF